MVTSAGPVERSDRGDRLCAQLVDERSGRVVFVSHCLLNENTRYPGGGFRPGAVEEAVGGYLAEGVGICQLPCPEQLAWGGVRKRHLLALCGRRRLAPAVGLLSRALTAYTSIRYRFLARRVAREISDYQRSGFEVVGVVGVDASPTCGVTTTLDIDASLGALVRCPIDRVDRRYMNEVVVNGATRPGRGLFIGALDRALAARGHTVPLLTHDLRSEMPASPLPPGPVPAGAAGAGTQSRSPWHVLTAARAVLRRRLRPDR